MNQTAERPGISERYALAARSSDLTVNPDARTDADMLLAAGYAAAGNEYASLALRFGASKRLRIGGLSASWQRLLAAGCNAAHFAGSARS